MNTTRHSPKREAILECLRSTTCHPSAEWVYAQLKPRIPDLSLATVYRNLKALVDDGTLAVVQLPGENPRYEPVSRRHHHHFQCRRCQRVFDVHDCPGDLKRMAPQGFVVERHELTLYGRCADCNAAAGATLPAAGTPPHACASGHDPA